MKLKGISEKGFGRLAKTAQEEVDETAVMEVCDAEIIITE